MTHEVRQSEALILAAGQGTRMGGEKAKVLYPVADRAMIHWVLDACEAAGVQRIVVIVGHQAEAVREALAGRDNVRFVEQIEQLGTGHAVMQAAHLYEDREIDLFVLGGDGPLIRHETLQTLLDTHIREGASATLATATIDNSTGYGRIVRDASGQFEQIVEHKDATNEQLAIREINPSYYCFRSGDLFDALTKISNDNAKGEYYLTDVPGILRSEGKKVAVIDAVRAEDVLSINTPEELEEVDQLLRQRLESGVAR